MLDLIFLVLMIIIMVKANKGEFAETLCNVALVVGFLAGILGLVLAFFTVSSYIIVLANILVVLLAFGLKPIARHFVKLYTDAEEEQRLRLLRDKERHSRSEDTAPVYTEENFDDPELRFGKGGYTDYDD